MLCVSSLVGIYSVLHFNANGRSWKALYCKVKTLNLVKLQRFFHRVLLKKSTSFTEELFKFALLLFTTCWSQLNSRSLAALVAITQNVFPARWLRPGNSITCVLGTIRECLYTSFVKPAARMRPSKLFIIVYVQYDSRILFLQSQIRHFRCNGI